MRSLWIAAALACFAAAGCSYEPLDVAPAIDLSRFQGQWYEIARLPRVTQTNCTGTTAFYVLRDGGWDITHQCHLNTLDGPIKSSAGRVQGAGTSAKLAIDIAGFPGDYWVLEVGEHYEYAVVGVPSRDYLSILSRTPQLDKATLDGIVGRMKASKFETSRLLYTLQGS